MQMNVKDYKLRHDFEVNRKWYPMANRYPMDLMSTERSEVLYHKQDFTKYINCSIILPKGFHLDLKSSCCFIDKYTLTPFWISWTLNSDQNYQTFWVKITKKSQIKLSLANEIAYRWWVSNLAGEFQIIAAGCRPIKTVFEAHLWDNISPHVPLYNASCSFSFHCSSIVPQYFPGADFKSLPGL
jgi:hypothetical protein